MSLATEARRFFSPLREVLGSTTADNGCPGLRDAYCNHSSWQLPDLQNSPSCGAREWARGRMQPDIT